MDKRGYVMSFITDMLMQQLSGNAVSQISQRLGVDQGVASQAIAMAAPLLMSAMARNASNPQGAQALHQALAQDHDGGILNNVSGFLGNAQAADGAGILGHLLGNQQGAVQNGLAQQTGLDANASGELLQMLAPLVMGAVGQTQQQQGLDANGLASMLGNHQQAAQSSSPDMMGMLGGLLDMNKDGNVIDDVGRIAGQFFGGR
jgi:hypothetical protein